MIGKIMRHEWRTLQREKSVWLILAVFGATMGYAVWHGAATMNRQAASINRFVQTQKDFLDDSRREAENMERQLASGLQIEALPEAERGKYAFGARQSSWIGTRQMYAALAPSPLAGLAVGQSELPPPAVLVTGGNVGGGVAGIPTENPLKFFVGHFDLARVIVFLFPLFILGLTFNLLSGERETGILRIIFAQPVKLRDLLAGKIAVRALIIFSSAILFSAAGFLLSGIDSSTDGNGWKLLLLTVVVLAYGVFWFALALLVNGFGYNSGTNALILTICWLLFVVIVPSIVNFIVTAAYPLPTQAEFLTANRLAREEANNLSDQEVSRRFFAAHPEFPADGDYRGDGNYYVLAHSRIEEIDRRMQALREKFNRQFAARQRAVEIAGFLSPAILTQSTFLKIAGTEPERYQRFLSQAEEFKKIRFAFFRPKLFEITKFADPNFASSGYELIPRFSFKEESDSKLVFRIVFFLGGMFFQILLIGFLIRRIYRKRSIAA